MMYQYVRPLLFQLDPETAHNLVKSIAQIIPAWLLPHYRVTDDRLKISLPLHDHTLTIFENPMGLAAGFDKNAELIHFMHALGFGFVEVGSVTYQPWLGNARPRLFRLPRDEALINRMGLNCLGAEAAATNIRRAREQLPKNFPIGVNIAKTADPKILGDSALDDYCQTFDQLHSLSDYLTINISCPNTQEGKTFEEPRALDELLKVLLEVNRDRAVFLKLSADLKQEQLEQLINVAHQHGISGYVVANTTTTRDLLTTDPKTIAAIGRGGLSGPPLYHRAVEMIGKVYDLTQGKVPIIGTGGVSSAKTAYHMMKAGASLVQLYTAFVYHGPGIVSTINHGLLELMDQDGVKKMQDVIGVERQ